jgi:hypothetical protein
VYTLFQCSFDDDVMVYFTYLFVIPSNELRFDAAGRGKVETAVVWAAASSRVELSRTQGYQRRPALWGLNVTQAHWMTHRTAPIHDCTLGEWPLGSKKGTNN